MTNNQHGQVPNKYLTVVYRDIAPGKEARELIEHPKMSASSWSHALNDRDAAIAQVSTLRTAHVQNPTEIEHDAGDVSKNGAGLNMSTQHTRIAELEAQIEALSGVQALSAGPGEPPGIRALMCVISSLRDTAHFSDEEGELTNDLRTLRDWAYAQTAAFLPSPTAQGATIASESGTTPAEQQAQTDAVYAELPEPDFGPGRYLGKAIGDAYTKDQMRDFADRTHALRMKQAAPKAAPGVGNSGFDHKTAADLLNNKTVSDEAVRKFVATSRWAHDERAALSATLLAMHGVMTSREAEIALLKKALLEAEAAPQQEAQPNYVVSLVGVKEIPTGVNTQNKLYTVNAASADEAVGKAVLQMPSDFPEHRLHTACFVAAPAQPAPAPLSDDAKDAARWRMVALIGDEVMLPPEKRTQAAAVKAYVDATHSGLDMTGAVDAALAAQGGKDA